MDHHPRADGNVRESTLSATNGNDVTATPGDNNSNNNNSTTRTFSNVVDANALPPREASARPRRMPTETTHRGGTRAQHDRGTTFRGEAQPSRPPVRIPTSSIGTSYVSGQQYHLHLLPSRQGSVHPERSTPTIRRDGERDSMVTASMSLSGAMSLLLPRRSSSATAPLSSTAISSSASEGTRIPMRQIPAQVSHAAVTEHDDIARFSEPRDPSGAVFRGTATTRNGASPTATRRDREEHPERRHLLQQRVHDEARGMNDRREPPLPGEFVARPSSPPWITAEPPDWTSPAPTAVPSAPMMGPTARPPVPGPRRNEPLLSVAPLGEGLPRETAMRTNERNGPPRPWTRPTREIGPQSTENSMSTRPSRTPFQGLHPDPFASRSGSDPVPGTSSNVYLTISNNRLHHADAPDPTDDSGATSEPSTSRVPEAAGSRREAGTQSSPPVATGTLASTDGPISDEVAIRNTPARALFLFELISAILDATTSLTSSSTSSESSDSSSSNQPVSGSSSATTWNSRGSSSSRAVGHYAQYLTAAIAATTIANAEQERAAAALGDRAPAQHHVGGRSTGRRYTDSEVNVVGTSSPYRSRQRNGLSSAMLGYRVGGDQAAQSSTSEIPSFGMYPRDRWSEAGTTSLFGPSSPSPSFPDDYASARGRLILGGGPGGSYQPYRRNGEYEEWDPDADDDDDDLRRFYASHTGVGAGSESLLDGGMEDWSRPTTIGVTNRSEYGENIGDGTPNPHRRSSNEEYSPNDEDQHRPSSYLYRYHDNTARPLLSRRNRMRGGLLPGAFGLQLRSSGTTAVNPASGDRSDAVSGGRALPLLPLHAPFSDSGLPIRSTIEILDANGIAFDAPVPYNNRHHMYRADLRADDSPDNHYPFGFFHPLARGGLTMTAPIGGERGLPEARHRRQRNQWIDVEVPLTERVGGSRRGAVDRRHPATCYESETATLTCTDEPLPIPAALPFENREAVSSVPLFYRVSRFHTMDPFVRIAIVNETRVTPQYYSYWHPNAVSIVSDDGL